MTEQFSLSWQNITVEVEQKVPGFWKTKVVKKVVLNNVSGSATSNSLFAIMGGSGAGKTTLLTAIAGHKKEKQGTLCVNNREISDDYIKNISCLVPQVDIFTEYLTVVEHLNFMASLQIESKSIGTKIQKLLQELSLEHIQSRLIKHLSGGEKRKLSLAGELISDPFILFCDEPTTGLDSYSAVQIVRKLQTIALTGKIVIATIHQPSSQLFTYFDNITLISEGKLVFQGTKQEATSFFERLDLFCPKNYNPAEFYVNCTTSGDVTKMVKAFEKQRGPKCVHNDTDKQVFFKKKMQKSFIFELKWLLWRCYLVSKRNLMGYYLGGYIIALIELIIVAFIYSSVSLNIEKSSIQSIQGLLALLGTEFVYINMYAVLSVFPDEIPIFLKEKSLYSSSAYFFSKLIYMIPQTLFSTMLYMSVFFIIISFLKGFYLWFKMTMILFIVSLTSCGLGLAFSATFSSIEEIDLYMIIVDVLLFTLSGFFVNQDTLPTTITWIRYLSPFYYCYDLLSNVFWSNSMLVQPNCMVNNTNPCYINATQLLDNYGYGKKYDPVAYNILFLHLLTALFCIIGFFGIARRKKLYSI